MKKIIAVLLSLFLLAGSCATLVSAVTDTTPPQLRNVTVERDTVACPGTIRFKISAKDDISGVKSIHLILCSSDNGQTRNTMELSQTGPEEFSVTLAADRGMKPGIWYLSDLILTDYAGNEVTYRPSDSSYGDHFYGQRLIFRASNPGYSSELPVLQEITISSHTANHPDSVTLRARVTSKNAISNIVASYMLDDSGTTAQVEFQQESGNWYRGVLHLGDQPNRYETYTFQSLSIIDIQGNYARYVPAGSPDVQNGAGLPLGQDLNVAVKNVRTEYHTTGPTLVSITPSKKTVAPPDVFTYTVQAKPNGGCTIREGYIIVVYTDPSGKDSPYYHVSTLQPFGADGKAVFQVTVSQYLEGTLRVSQCVLTDSDGNRTEYLPRASDGTLSMEPFRKATEVAIVPGGGGDVSAGTMTKDLLPQIQNAKDDSVIRVDCENKTVFPGAGFDAIRGTNKKLILECNGAQWIFTGSQLPHPSKDIDVNIMVGMSGQLQTVNGRLADAMTGGAPSLIISFAPNGLLPGPALVRIKADYTFRDFVGVKDLYFYYLNEEEGEADLVCQKLEMDSDGYYSLPIEHNSTFVLSSAQIDPKFVSAKSGGQSTGEGKQLLETIRTEILEDGSAADSVSGTESETAGPETPAENKKSILAPVLLTVAGVLAVGAAIGGVWIWRKRHPSPPGD